MWSTGPAQGGSPQVDEAKFHFAADTRGSVAYSVLSIAAEGIWREDAGVKDTLYLQLLNDPLQNAPNSHESWIHEQSLDSCPQRMFMHLQSLNWNNNLFKPDEILCDI